MVFAKVDVYRNAEYKERSLATNFFLCYQAEGICCEFPFHIVIFFHNTRARCIYFTGKSESLNMCFSSPGSIYVSLTLEVPKSALNPMKWNMYNEGSSIFRNDGMERNYLFLTSCIGPDQQQFYEILRSWEYGSERIPRFLPCNRTK